jgi:hypothetical protein
VGEPLKRSVRLLLEYFMKCFLLILILSIPIVAQEGERAYFERRLEEARKGDASAQDDVGVLYAEGRGVRRNDLKAVYWLKKSAAQGDVLGSCNLALHYARGQGIRKNPILALKWAFISHSLDGLKCFPDDFLYFFRPKRSAVKKAWQRADAFLMSHPELKNEFGERPWLDAKPQPNTRLERTRR